MSGPMSFLGRVRALGGRAGSSDDAAEAARQRALADLGLRALEGA
jgi:hypothetical protein